MYIQPHFTPLCAVPLLPVQESLPTTLRLANVSGPGPAHKRLPLSDILPLKELYSPFRAYTAAKKTKVKEQRLNTITLIVGRTEVKQQNIKHLGFGKLFCVSHHNMIIA